MSVSAGKSGNWGPFSTLNTIGTSASHPLCSVVLTEDEQKEFFTRFKTNWMSVVESIPGYSRIHSNNTDLRSAEDQVIFTPEECLRRWNVSAEQLYELWKTLQDEGEDFETDVLSNKRANESMIGGALKRATMRVYFDLTKSSNPTQPLSFESAAKILHRSNNVIEDKAVSNDALKDSGAALGVGKSLQKLLQGTPKVTKVWEVRHGLFIAQVKVSTIRNKHRWEVADASDEVDLASTLASNSKLKVSEGLSNRMKVLQGVLTRPPPSSSGNIGGTLSSIRSNDSGHSGAQERVGNRTISFSGEDEGEAGGLRTSSRGTTRRPSEVGLTSSALRSMNGSETGSVRNAGGTTGSVGSSTNQSQPHFRKKQPPKYYYIVNGFVPYMEELYVGKPTTSPANDEESCGSVSLDPTNDKLLGKGCDASENLQYFSVEWSADTNDELLDWKMFKSRIVGHKDPSQALPGSFRNILYSQWRKFGLSEAPNRLNNCIHMSDSSFDGMCERLLWMKLRIQPKCEVEVEEVQPTPYMSPVVSSKELLRASGSLLSSLSSKLVKSFASLNKKQNITDFSDVVEEVESEEEKNEDIVDDDEADEEGDEEGWLKSADINDENSLASSVSFPVAAEPVNEEGDFNEKIAAVYADPLGFEMLHESTANAGNATHVTLPAELVLHWVQDNPEVGIQMSALNKIRGLQESFLEKVRDDPNRLCTAKVSEHMRGLGNAGCLQVAAQLYVVSGANKQTIVGNSGFIQNLVNETMKLQTSQSHELSGTGNSVNAQELDQASLTSSDVSNTMDIGHLAEDHAGIAHLKRVFGTMAGNMFNTIPDSSESSYTSQSKPVPNNLLELAAGEVDDAVDCQVIIPDRKISLNVDTSTPYAYTPVNKQRRGGIFGLIQNLKSTRMLTDDNDELITDSRDPTIDAHDDSVKQAVLTGNNRTLFNNHNKKNAMFVVIPPCSNTEKYREEVLRVFRTPGVQILASGTVFSEEILAKLGRIAPIIDHSSEDAAAYQRSKFLEEQKEKYGKYLQMIQMKLPENIVRDKMAKDGISNADISKLFHSLPEIRKAMEEQTLTKKVKEVDSDDSDDEIEIKKKQVEDHTAEKYSRTVASVIRINDMIYQQLSVYAQLDYFSVEEIEYFRSKMLGGGGQLHGAKLRSILREVDMRPCDIELFNYHYLSALKYQAQRELDIANAGGASTVNQDGGKNHRQSLLNAPAEGILLRNGSRILRNGSILRPGEGLIRKGSLFKRKESSSNGFEDMSDGHFIASWLWLLENGFIYTPTEACLAFQMTPSDFYHKKWLPECAKFGNFLQIRRGLCVCKMDINFIDPNYPGRTPPRVKGRVFVLNGFYPYLLELYGIKSGVSIALRPGYLYMYIGAWMVPDEPVKNEPVGNNSNTLALPDIVSKQDDSGNKSGGAASRISFLLGKSASTPAVPAQTAIVPTVKASASKPESQSKTEEIEDGKRTLDDDASIKNGAFYISIEWCDVEVSYADFYRCIIGHPNPAKADPMSLRGKLFADGLTDYDISQYHAPSALFSGVHASGSAFEAMVERFLWVYRPLHLAQGIKLFRDKLNGVGMDVGEAQAKPAQTVRSVGAKRNPPIVCQPVSPYEPISEIMAALSDDVLGDFLYADVLGVQLLVSSHRHKITLAHVREWMQNPLIALPKGFSVRAQFVSLFTKINAAKEATDKKNNPLADVETAAVVELDDGDMSLVSVEDSHASISEAVQEQVRLFDFLYMCGSQQCIDRLMFLLDDDSIALI